MRSVPSRRGSFIRRPPAVGFELDRARDVDRVEVARRSEAERDGGLGRSKAKMHRGHAVDLRTVADFDLDSLHLLRRRLGTTYPRFRRSAPPERDVGHAADGELRGGSAAFLDGHLSATGASACGTLGPARTRPPRSGCRSRFGSGFGRQVCHAGWADNGWMQAAGEPGFRAGRRRPGFARSSRAGSLRYL